MSLKTLPADSTPDDIVKALQDDGAVIVKDVIDAEMIARMTGELDPYIKATPMGRDDFTGRQTQRTGALVARTPTCRELITHDTVLSAAKLFLKPYTDRILLHLTQTIHINPGNPAQPLHRDRLAWGGHIPKEVEPQFNTIWALTDFTKENGATRCVPGSHKWDWDERADPEQVVQAEMTAGSVFFYTGSVLHSGGENRSEASRLGLNLTYCLGWLRTEENQYLSCPPHIAKDLDPELQALLGYTQATYALGYYSDPEAMADRSDILPPEVALERWPDSGMTLASSGGGEVRDFSEVEQL
eukprot:g15560.t1